MQSTITALRSRVRSLGASAAGADGKNIVAFSGGVDSSLVAALVHHVFPGSSQACVGVSSALPAAQLDLARRVASHIGKEFGKGVVCCEWKLACAFFCSKKSKVRLPVCRRVPNSAVFARRAATSVRRSHGATQSSVHEKCTTIRPFAALVCLSVWYVS